MNMNGTNYQTFECGAFGDLSRVMLKDNLAATGMELSLNRLPAGQAIPFVHAHKQNEEVYLFIRGTGTFWIDGQGLQVGEGSAVRVSPPGARTIKASDGEDLCYICIQAQAGSLRQATRDDGFILDRTVDW